MVKVICGWCNKLIRLEVHGDHDRVIVCQDCKTALFRQIHESITGPAYQPLRVRGGWGVVNTQIEV
jgi:hypothetical protein